MRRYVAMRALPTPTTTAPRPIRSRATQLAPGPIWPRPNGSSMPPAENSRKAKNRSLIEQRISGNIPQVEDPPVHRLQGLGVKLVPEVLAARKHPLDGGLDGPPDA